MWRIVRKVVDSPIHLRGDVRSLACHPRRDVQADTQHQHTQHCKIPGHTGVTERQRGDTGGCYTVFLGGFCLTRFWLKTVFKSKEAEVTWGTGPGQRCHGCLGSGAAPQSAAPAGDSLDTRQTNKEEVIHLCDSSQCVCVFVRVCVRAWLTMPYLQLTALVVSACCVLQLRCVQAPCWPSQDKHKLLSTWSE